MTRTVLFIHQNFPGQYRHLAPALQARGHPAAPLHRCDALPPLGG